MSAVFEKKVHVVAHPVFYCVEQWTSVYHARIGIGCSNFNSDLHFNLHVRDSPFCLFGHWLENSDHFQLHCSLYECNVSHSLSVFKSQNETDVDLLLRWSSSITLRQNHETFEIVHN